MNKRLDLSKLGGYPLSQKDLDWMQVSWRGAFAAMSGLIGDKVIISGMTEAAGSVSAGWISINNELVPFLAGAIGSGEFIIDETSETLVFKDGVGKIVRYERVARFSAGGAYQYSDLKRVCTIKETWQRGDVKEIDCDEAYITANFDGTGLGIGERVGWAVCNGNNGTRNRKGKVSVQLDTSQTEFDLMGETGGSKTHTLSIPEMPAHGHKVFTTGNQAGVDPGRAIQRSSTNGDPYETGAGSSPYIQTTGGGGAHNNMQPYIVSLFIMKL